MKKSTKIILIVLLLIISIGLGVLSVLLIDRNMIVGSIILIAMVAACLRSCRLIIVEFKEDIRL